MSDIQPATSDVRRLPRFLRVVILIFSIALVAAFVLFAAALVIMPSTKSSRIAWPDDFERESSTTATAQSAPAESP
jgi:hypothetical protein